MTLRERIRKHRRLVVSPYGLVFFDTNQYGVSGTKIYKELSQQELAELMGVSLRTIKSISASRKGKVYLKECKHPITDDCPYDSLRGGQETRKCSCCKQVKRLSKMVHIGNRTIDTCKDCADKRMDSLLKGESLSNLYSEDDDGEGDVELNDDVFNSFQESI